MDDKHHDKVFFVTFGAVVAFLGTFTLSIMAIANMLDDPPADAEEIARIEERIKPAGQAVTDAAQLMNVSAPAAAARAPMTGSEIVTKVCTACHGTGVLNAPKTGNAGDWAPRKGQGMSGLVASAIKGKGSMPPRGGDPSLSEAEVKAAVEVLLKGT